MYVCFAGFWAALLSALNSLAASCFAYRANYRGVLYPNQNMNKNDFISFYYDFFSWFGWFLSSCRVLVWCNTGMLTLDCGCVSGGCYWSLGEYRDCGVAVS